MMTFIQATFVHISHTSAFNDSIFTKLFGPNIQGFLIFVNTFFLEQNSFGQNIFRTNFFFGPNLFYDLNFLEPQGLHVGLQFFYQTSSDPNIYWTIFFTYIFRSRFCLTKKNFTQKIFRSKFLFFWQTFSLTTYLGPIKFGPHFF